MLNKKKLFFNLPFLIISMVVLTETIIESIKLLSYKARVFMYSDFFGKTYWTYKTEAQVILIICMLASYACLIYFYSQVRSSVK